MKPAKALAVAASDGNLKSMRALLKKDGELASDWQPIMDAWRENPNIKIFGYPSGTWGPRQAVTLFDRAGDDWRYPCRNLTDDGESCEL